MKHRKLICLLLALIMAVSLCACGGNPASESGGAAASETRQPETEAPAQEPSDSPDQPEETSEPQTEPTGQIISAEDARAQGYDVKYGMYDYETYIPLPLVEEETELSFWTWVQPFAAAYNIDISQSSFYKELEKRTGVHLDMDVASFFAVEEQFNLLVNAGECRDIMSGVSMLCHAGTGKMVDDDIFLALNDIIDKHMPNYKAYLDTYPLEKVGATNLDGTIVLVGTGATYAMTAGPQMRGDWLKELSLSEPVTYDDWHDVLTAFATEYNAGLWLSLSGTTRFNALSAAYDVLFTGMYKPFRVIDDVVEFSPYTEDYGKYLTMLNQWWSEGLIYKDFMSQPDILVPDNSLVVGGQIGMWVADASDLINYTMLDENVHAIAIEQPRFEKDQQLHYYMPEASDIDGAAISTNCSNVELAARWLDYYYTYDGYILGNYGVEGEGLKFDENGNPGLTDLVLNNPDGITAVACLIIYAKFGGAGATDIYRELAGYNDQQKAAMETWNGGLDVEREYTGKLTPDEQQEANGIYGEIETYVNENTVKFIIGDRPMSDWEDFEAQLKAMGVERLTEIYQTGHDRYAEMLQKAEE